MSDREIMESKPNWSKSPNWEYPVDSKPNWAYSDTKIKKQLPDAYKHQVVSFIKSGVRILGFGVCWWSLDIGLTLLILAEVIGIGEELV